MIDEMPHVPPALIMLYSELAGERSWSNMRKKLKGMLKDLRDQSEGYQLYQFTNGRSDDSFNKFEIHLHGEMDLLTNSGCMELPCRIATAERIARSLGLISDRIWITDLLTEKFINFGRVTNDKLDYILEDLVVLFTLFPLIVEGLIKFRTPWVTTCPSCTNEFYSQVEDITKIVAKLFQSEFDFRKNPDGFTANVGRCVEPSLVLQGFDNTPLKKVDFINGWTSNQINSILWTAREASFTGGSIVSNSRIGLAGLLQSDGRLTSRSTLKLLDNERESRCLGLAH